MIIRLETAYLPPLSYVRWWLSSEQLVLEAHENYQKGGYRNRTLILGANGPLRLTIPLVKGKNQAQPIREVRIDNNKAWQRQHWQSIRSAYGKAPYFEHYADLFEPHYRRPFDFLFDFNLALLQTLARVLRSPAPTPSDGYHCPGDQLDLRNRLRPNRPLPDALAPRPYPQVFGDRFAFVPRLGVLDALFCGAPIEKAPLPVG